MNVFRHRIWASLFFISGFAALLYQTVWIKWLSLQLGHSAWAIATVVAVFMAGLGLGGWLAGRFSDRLKRLAYVYAAIEFGVALFALLSWPLLEQLPRWIAPFYGVPYVFFVLRVAACFLILLLPTVMMGASLPIVVAADRRQVSFAKTVGFYYGCNTLGSAMGALAAGFFFLPVLGVHATLLSAISLSCAVALVAIYFLPATTEIASDTSSPSAVSRSVRGSVVLLAAVCGFWGLFLEIGWARLLAPVLGSSTYTFCLILFVYLVGSAVGSLSVAKYASTSRRVYFWACCSLIVASISALMGLPIINGLPHVFTRLAPLTKNLPLLFFALQAALVAVLVFVPTMALGAALPCLVSVHKGDSEIGGPSLGHVYAWNTVGAIIGCFLTGFVFLPMVGVSLSFIRVAACVIATAALFILIDAELPRLDRMKYAAGGALLAVVVFVYWPNVNMKNLQAGSFRSVMQGGGTKSPSGDLLFVRDGISSTVAVYRSSNQTTLRINGKTDASSTGDLATQLLLGHLPMMFHPNAKRVCVIGYGSGATVNAVHSYRPASIDVVELEPAVIEASPFFQAINDAVLDNPEVRVHIEDGRTFLNYGKNTFDVIISEPTNPWIAGVGNLFSREFYQRVQHRLSKGGVFCQWIQAYELSRPTLNVMLHTLKSTFPHVSLFVGDGDFICVASETPLNATFNSLSKRMSGSDVKRSLGRIGVENPYDLLLGYYQSFPEDQDRYASAVDNTDDNSYLEYHAPMDMYSGAAPLLDRPSTSAVFDRYSTQFFSDVKKSDLALGLANSLAHLRPFAFFRIDEMIPLFTDTNVVQRLEAWLRNAQSRAAAMDTIIPVITAAQQKMQQGHFSEAEKMLLPLLDVVPHQPGLHRLLGVAAARDHRNNDAINYFMAALQDNPADYETLTELGKIRMEESNVPAAIACFARALEANPHAATAQQLKSQLLGSK